MSDPNRPEQPGGGVPPVPPTNPSVPPAPDPYAGPAYGEQAQPNTGYAQPVAGYSQASHDPAGKTNTLALVSLIASLVGLVSGVGFLVGIICGHIALSQIERASRATAWRSPAPSSATWAS